MMCDEVSKAYNRAAPLYGPKITQFLTLLKRHWAPKKYSISLLCGHHKCITKLGSWTVHFFFNLLDRDYSVHNIPGQSHQHCKLHPHKSRHANPQFWDWLHLWCTLESIVHTFVFRLRQTSRTWLIHPFQYIFPCDR